MCVRVCVCVFVPECMLPSGCRKCVCGVQQLKIRALHFSKRPLGVLWGPNVAKHSDKDTNTHPHTHSTIINLCFIFFNAEFN